MTPIQRVEAFIESWNHIDFDAIDEALDDDIVYHNIPMEPVIGKTSASAMIRGFMANFSACEWTTHNIAATGNIVLTERTDRFTHSDGKVAAIRVMGAFELSDEGKITHWRDYFDSAEMAREFGMVAAAERLSGEA